MSSVALQLPPRNEGLESRRDLPTPALLVDLDALDANIAVVSHHLALRGKAFRPHAKTHKCPQLARRLLAAGAVGACVAKLGEAEVFVAEGIPGLLLTTAVIGAAKIDRAIALAARAPDTIFCADAPENVAVLNEAAQRANITLNIAVDLYFGRTGIAPGEPAAALAECIARSSNLRFAGLQAYDASASHILDEEPRRARSTTSVAAAVATAQRLRSRGIECSLISGGSTGTYVIDSHAEGLTELQPGSFVFLDVDYRRVAGATSGLRPALSVLTTVISRHGSEVIVDGGYKAFSTDRPFGPQAIDLAGALYSWAGDEHGRVDVSQVGREVSLGEQITFLPPHCDPTVNLYDRLYAMRGERVEEVWPIAARGRSD